MAETEPGTEPGAGAESGPATRARASRLPGWRPPAQTLQCRPSAAEVGGGGRLWATGRSSALGEVNRHRPTGPGRRTRVCVAFYYLAYFPCSLAFPRARTCPVTTPRPVRPRSASLSKGASRRCSRLVGSAERGSQSLALLVPHTASRTVLGTLWPPRVLVKVVNNPIAVPA